VSNVTLLMLEDQQLPRTWLQLWGGPEGGAGLNVRRFATLEALRSAAEQLRPRRKTGLSLLFEVMWHYNWAHAIFDALYPAFVSLAKFGRQKDPFLPVLYLGLQEHGRTVGRDCKQRAAQVAVVDCAMEEAIRLFGSLGHESGELMKRHPPLAAEELLSHSEWLVFDEMIIGSGHGGEYFSISSLPGMESFESSAPREDVLLTFRERLYQAHGVPPPSRRTRSNEGRDPSVPLKVIITDNERHTPDLRVALSQLAASFNGEEISNTTVVSNVSDTLVAEAASSSPPGRLNVSFVNWASLQPWREQLKVLREVDILVSGIGTALFYSLLLPDGAATINLGWNSPRGAWGGKMPTGKGAGANAPGFPSYGEEFLGMSNRRARTFYVPLDQVRRGPRAVELAFLMGQVEATVRNGFEIPLVSPEENLGVFGKIVFDLQKRSEASFRGLSGLPQIGSAVDNYTAHAMQEYSCHSRATGQASAADLVYEQTTRRNVPGQPPPEPLPTACRVDLRLLRQLKVEHRLKEALGVTAECECIVCEACGLS